MRARRWLLGGGVLMGGAVIAGCGGAGDAVEPVVEPVGSSAPVESSASGAPRPEPTVDLPLPVAEGWDPEDAVWGGFPPPVVFQPVFPSGDWPGFPETFEGHALAEEMDFGNSFRGDYQDDDGNFSLAFEVLANPLAYEAQLERWAEPERVGFAVCDAAEPERPDCMGVAADAVFNLTWVGDPGAFTVEEVAESLGAMMVELAEG